MTPAKWLQQLSESIGRVQGKLRGQVQPPERVFVRASELILETRGRDATVWWVGNGGSAALCSHLSQDLVNKLSVRSMLLGDAALLTCMANDYGYANVYHKPLRTMARQGDLLIAISSSGNSENILKCVELAGDIGMGSIALSAFSGQNKLWASAADVSFFVPCDLYGHAEIAHGALLHAVIESLWLVSEQADRG
jgi:D-sedoheptulose 7-phosphate isomerase